MRYKRLLIFEILFVILLILNFASADFTKGNPIYNITILGYHVSDPVLGWINISIKDEPANSLLTGFNSNITLKDFLINNSANFSCNPMNCKEIYSKTGNPATTKNIPLNYNELYAGIRLTGLVSDIKNIKFDVLTDSQEACAINPLRIDLLNDGLTEWKNIGVSQSACSVDNSSGCFDSTSTIQNAQLTNDSIYCETISVYPGKGYKIGANINGSGGAGFKLSMTLNSGEEKDCLDDTSSSGEVSCNVILDTGIEDITPVEVCLTPMNLNGNYYSIKYEDNSVCGYLKNSNGEPFPHDFDIFAKPLKYSTIPSFTFNQNLIDSMNVSEILTDSIKDYISNNYNWNCTPECIIPIKFTGISQNLILSNLNLQYEASGILKTESNFYDIKNSYSLINSDFLKLDLSKANIVVPSSTGIKRLVLRLGGNEIFRTDLEVVYLNQSTGTNIIDVLPHNPPALVSTTFMAVLQDLNKNYSFSWNFGDGTSEVTTKTNIVKHFYVNGSYDLTLKVVLGDNISSKTIRITTRSPKDYINQTINDVRNNLNNFEIEVNKFPDWIKKEIFRKIGNNYFSDMRSSIKRLEDNYKQAFTTGGDSEYVTIMDSLLRLNIPTKLKISRSIGPVEFLLGSNQIDLDILDEIGAGKYAGNSEKYSNLLNQWMRDNLKINMDTKTYTLTYRDNREESLLNYMKFDIIPLNQDLENVYFVVRGNPDNIVFSPSDSKDLTGKAKSIRFNTLTEEKNVEFLYPQEIDLNNVPVFISPDVNKVGIAEPDVGNCNHNKICEKELGENFSNCKDDCRSWLPTLIYWLILLLVALIIYIILQEWYKRHYESSLFSNKNQLFNLINFMSTSLNQGIRKNEIFSKLKERGWNHEQLDYAWNKLHGKRTGMWEIPIFKGMENREVRREIEKRGGSINNRSLYLR